MKTSDFDYLSPRTRAFIFGCILLLLCLSFCDRLALGQAKPVVTLALSGVSDGRARALFRDAFQKQFPNVLVVLVEKCNTGSDCLPISFPEYAGSIEGEGYIEAESRQVGASAGRRAGQEVGNGLANLVYMAKSQIVRSVGGTLANGGGQVLGDVLYEEIGGGGGYTPKFYQILSQINGQQDHVLEFKFSGKKGRFKLEQVGTPNAELISIRSKIPFGLGYGGNAPTAYEAVISWAEFYARAARGTLKLERPYEIPDLDIVRKAFTDVRKVSVDFTPSQTPHRTIRPRPVETIDSPPLTQIPDLRDARIAELEAKVAELANRSSAPVVSSTTSVVPAPVDATASKESPMEAVPATFSLDEWANKGPFLNDYVVELNGPDIVGEDIDKLLGYLVLNNYMGWKQGWCRRLRVNGKIGIEKMQRSLRDEQSAIANLFGIEVNGKLDKQTRAFLNYRYSRKAESFKPIQDLRPGASRTCEMPKK